MLCILQCHEENAILYLLWVHFLQQFILTRFKWPLSWSTCKNLNDSYTKIDIFRMSCVIQIKQVDLLGTYCITISIVNGLRKGPWRFWNVYHWRHAKENKKGWLNRRNAIRDLVRRTRTHVKFVSFHWRTLTNMRGTWVIYAFQLKIDHEMYKCTRR